MALIHTKLGPVDETLLTRTVVFKDQPNEFTVEVEYHLRAALDVPGIEVDDVGNTVEGVRHGEAGELVKRDAHVIQKEPSVIASALIGGF